MRTPIDELVLRVALPIAVAILSIGAAGALLLGREIPPAYYALLGTVYGAFGRGFFKK